MFDQISVPRTIQGNSNESSWILNNHDATIQFGECLVKALSNTQILLLDGPLGAGKTSLVKGLGIGLCISEPITSPTFALAHHYLMGERALIHLDLYRLGNPIAANELFFQEEEIANNLNGLMVIEWPSRLKIEINDACKMQIQYLPNGGRKIQLLSFKKDDNRLCTSE
ncbi:MULTISPECIES: tRNA (adenosine(37)-N6)-threonylcarbamoyltransferase complex ATPase subunit type 1 TsaE [Prochlorococcus]|uniref:tRNA threonylcarbamoyladenosine biosynthesis protein TsaE n=1 Tax=Prochlorococcus marinus (strain SARG / CCMP1375 / SS120) TaxID=167539 RepID=Q7V9P2_PROMA|nr:MULTISPECIES: tRNA (adenosine(37)-N6)-threonylcarbamoyltransferase complex ATPase subunit type 1 TsaE [Prochlorococcus]AAQ00831.1 Uncharacterized P-loop hydrolase [Prochlorococcus marinus subsp. marinus str. CCMP1375]